MPPITSRRPGALETAIEAPRSNNPRVRSVARNPSTSAPPARTKLLLQQRLDLFADVHVRVADPGDVGLRIEWHVERVAARIGHDDAALLRDQGATHIVGMTAETRRHVASAEHCAEK